MCLYMCDVIVCTLVESWHCVASVYFLDTAHNIIAYLHTIYNILVPGGYLVNFGMSALCLRLCSISLVRIGTSLSIFSP